MYVFIWLPLFGKSRPGRKAPSEFQGPRPGLLERAGPRGESAVSSGPGLRQAALCTPRARRPPVPAGCQGRGGPGGGRSAVTLSGRPRWSRGAAALCGVGAGLGRCLARGLVRATRLASPKAWRLHAWSCAWKFNSLKYQAKLVLYLSCITRSSDGLFREAEG